MKAVAQTFCSLLWSLFLFSFRSANLFWYWRNERVALGGEPSQSRSKTRSKRNDSSAGWLKMDPVSRAVWREDRHLLPPRCFAKVTQGIERAALLQHEHCRHFHLVVLLRWRLGQRCSILASAELLNWHSVLWICEVRLFLAGDAADYAWLLSADRRQSTLFSFITCSWTHLRHSNELRSWLLCQNCFLLFFVSALCFYVFVRFWSANKRKKPDVLKMIIC